MGVCVCVMSGEDMGLCACGYPCVSMKSHRPGSQGGRKCPRPPAMAHMGDTQHQPPRSLGPCVQTSGGLPLPEDHHRVEEASRPPPIISPSIPHLSQLLPVLMEGKNFSFFLLYFSRRVTRSGKEFPPPQTIIIPINRCHRYRPILLCWDSHRYFWALYGGGTPGEGIWWEGAQLSFPSPHPPSQVPPHPHPSCLPEFWEEGRKPA